MINIVTDKAGLYRLQVIPKNSKIPIITSTKGHNIETILCHVNIMQNGEFFGEIETANMSIPGGTAVYFTIFSETGEKLGVSKVYTIKPGRNPRNVYVRAITVAQRSIDALQKYCDKYQFVNCY